MLNRKLFEEAAAPFGLKVGPAGPDLLTIGTDRDIVLVVTEVSAGVVRFVPQVGPDQGKSLMPSSQENVHEHAATCARDLAIGRPGTHLGFSSPPAPVPEFEPATETEPEPVSDPA